MKRKTPKFRVGQVVCWKQSFGETFRRIRKVEDGHVWFEDRVLPWAFVRPLTKREAGRR